MVCGARRDDASAYPREGRMTTNGLHSKVVVVTGAGSGIGRATALAAAGRGAKIAACDRDPARVAALANELGGAALVVRCVDVSSRGEMASFADDVHRRAAAADVVVNNAGVALGGVFLETTLDDWDWLLGVNLRGVIHGCHYFVPKMVERAAGGHVVNVSSILGIFPAPTVTAYVASKFAVLGFSRALRVELAEHNIGVTAICPGMIATSIAGDSRIARGVEGRREKVKKLMASRGANPEVVAAAILDSVKSNPEVRTVGRDAAIMHAIQRFMPMASSRITRTLLRRIAE